MPKKTPKNAFYFYMKEMQDEMREGGQTLPIKDIVPIAVPMYKTLPREEKLRFQKMEQDYKTKRKETDIDRLTSDGIPITTIISEENERIKKEEEIAKAVRMLVNHSVSKIQGMPFYIISFNVLVVTREGEFLPNELAMVNYSLYHGMRESYHTFIDPQVMPLGYFSAAKIHSKVSHNLPVPMSNSEELKNVKVETDYHQIMIDILKFTNASDQKQILFAHGSQLEQIQGCFHWLHYRVPDLNIDNIMFADIALLLMELFKNIGQPLASPTTADDILSTNIFDYAVNTRCTYHEDIDSCYCALGFARRMAFIISDALTEKYGLELTKFHLPERQSVVKIAFPVHAICPNLGLLSIANSVKDDDDDDEENGSDVSDSEIGATAVPCKMSQNSDLMLSSNVLFPDHFCNRRGDGATSL